MAQSTNDFQTLARLLIVPLRSLQLNKWQSSIFMSKKLCQTNLNSSQSQDSRVEKETSSANNTKWKWFMGINICCLLKVSCSQYISTFFFLWCRNGKNLSLCFLIISDSLIYIVIGSETILQLNKHLFKLKKLKLSWLARVFLMKMGNVRKMAFLLLFELHRSSSSLLVVPMIKNSIWERGLFAVFVWNAWWIAFQAKVRWKRRKDRDDFYGNRKFKQHAQ